VTKHQVVEFQKISTKKEQMSMEGKTFRKGRF